MNTTTNLMMTTVLSVVAALVYTAPAATQQPANAGPQGARRKARRRRVALPEYPAADAAAVADSVSPILAILANTRGGRLYSTVSR